MSYGIASRCNRSSALVDRSSVMMRSPSGTQINVMVDESDMRKHDAKNAVGLQSAWVWTKSTWTWAKEKPLLASVLPLAESVSEFACDKLGTSLEQLDAEYVVPSLQKLDKDVMDPSIAFVAEQYTKYLGDKSAGEAVEPEAAPVPAPTQ